MLGRNRRNGDNFVPFFTGSIGHDHMPPPVQYTNLYANAPDPSKAQY